MTNYYDEIEINGRLYVKVYPWTPWIAATNEMLVKQMKRLRT